MGMAFVHYPYTDQQRTSVYVDQTLRHVSHYYRIHGRESCELRSAAVLGVTKAVRIDCARRTEVSRWPFDVGSATYVVRHGTSTRREAGCPATVYWLNTWCSSIVQG